MAELKTNLPAPVPSLIILLVEALDPLIALVTFMEPAFVIPNVMPAVLVIPAVLIVKVLVPLVASVLILDAVCAVKPPVKVAAAELLINLIAPPLVIPVPFKVMASGIVKALAPLISTAAPVPTMVPCEPDKVPNASLLATCITPAVTEVVPA